MKTKISVLMLSAAASVLSFLPACTEVHNDAPARGGSGATIERRESTQSSTTGGYVAPGSTTVTHEHEEEIRR